MPQQPVAEGGTARPGTDTGSVPAVFVTFAVVQSTSPSLMDAVIRHTLGIEEPVEVTEEILGTNARLRTRQDHPLAFELYLMVAVGGTVSPMPVLDLHADRAALAAMLRGAGLPLRDRIPFLESVAGSQVVPDGSGGYRLDAVPAAEVTITALPLPQPCSC